MQISCFRKGQILFCQKKTNKKHSDSNKKFSETDIIKMIEFIFINNIFVMFSGRVFQRSTFVWVPTVPSFRQLDSIFVQRLLNKNQKKLVRSLNFTLYIWYPFTD